MGVQMFAAAHLPNRYIRDVPVNEHSFASARVAAGTAARVAVAVARGEVKNGAAIVRPPGELRVGGMGGRVERVAEHLSLNVCVCVCGCGCVCVCVCERESVCVCACVRE